MKHLETDPCPKCGSSTLPEWREGGQALGRTGPESMVGVLYARCQLCSFRWPIGGLDQEEAAT